MPRLLHIDQSIRWFALFGVWAVLFTGEMIFAAEIEYQPIDLQEHAKQALDEDFHQFEGNNLQPLPKGKVKFKDVEFTIGKKFIQLASKRATECPESAKEIPVNRSATRLHFLHACGWGSPTQADGTLIGRYVVHYEDGTDATIPIEYGRDLRDWWDFDDNIPVSRAETVWRGQNKASVESTNGVKGIRLYQYSWVNPHPEKKMKSFDFISTNDSDCAPFLVALSSDYIPTLIPAERNLPRHAAINERAKQGNVELLFLGDSITQLWENNGAEVWKARYDKRKAMNAGIGGDTTQHVLWRLDHGNIDNISPKLVVLMIGTNNFGGNSATEISAGILAVVEKLRSKLPKATVLLLGVFPRGEKKDDPLRQKMQDINDQIKNRNDRNFVRYLNINDKLLKEDGSQDLNLMPDLVHLSPKGYQIWADAIEPVVAEVLEGEFPFPDLPEGAGKIDANASKKFTETEVGLRYRVLRSGKGKVPALTDTVIVDYKGWLDDGTGFDSSYERGEPATFPLNRVIRGWTEGLQHVLEGGMIELVIPASMGYGARGAPPKIPPNATLHFLVELLEISAEN